MSTKPDSTPENNLREFWLHKSDAIAVRYTDKILRGRLSTVEKVEQACLPDELLPTDGEGRPARPKSKHYRIRRLVKPTERELLKAIVEILRLIDRTNAKETEMKARDLLNDNLLKAEDLRSWQGVQMVAEALANQITGATEPSR